MAKRAASSSRLLGGGDEDKMKMNIIEKLLLTSVQKNELKEIKKYKSGKNIKQHLQKIDTKLDEMKICEKEKATFLIDSLEKRAQNELYSLPQFKANKCNYEWIKETLKDLFHVKVSDVNPLMELLNLKQQPKQRIRDFLSDVRIKAWKLMSDEGSDKREEYSIMAFANGLLNKKCQLALKQLNPQTLDEAYKMIKRDDILELDEDENLRLLSPVKQDSLEKTIALLTKEISDLKLQVNKLSQSISYSNKRAPYAAVLSNPHYPQKPFQQMVNRVAERPIGNRQNGMQNSRLNPLCYNCNNFGHIARQCTYPVICRYCKESGHSIQNCVRRPMRQNNVPKMRHFAPFDKVSEPDTMDLIDDLPPNGSEENEAALPQISIINNSTKPEFVRQQQKAVSYPHDVINWSAYINGQGKQPKKPLHQAKTVISKSNGEFAANKPVVPCKVENVSKNVLFDSGSECNVIDEAFHRRLGLKLWKKHGNMRCANGSPLEIVGYTLVKLDVGGKTFICKFTVVREIFPNVIVGLRTMKKEHICIKPAEDCIFINSVKVNFLSKTEEISENLTAPTQ